MGFKPTALFSKKHKELKVLVFTFENSNEKQKHKIKSLSGIQTHLPLTTLLQRTEVDDNCRYVVILLISGRTFVSFQYRLFSRKGQGYLSYKREATIQRGLEPLTLLPLFFTVQKLFEPSQTMKEQFLRPSFYLSYTVL